VEKIIWEALFEIAEGSRDPDLILVDLVNSRLPWQMLTSPSLPESERCWFDLSGDNGTLASASETNSSAPLQLESTLPVPSEAMDLSPDGAIPTRTSREPSPQNEDPENFAENTANSNLIDVRQNAVRGSEITRSRERSAENDDLENSAEGTANSNSVHVRPDAARGSENTLSSNKPVDTDMGVAGYRMDTEQDLPTALDKSLDTSMDAAIEEDADGEEDPLYSNAQEREETQVVANSSTNHSQPMMTAGNIVPLPPPPIRSSSRINEKKEQPTMSSDIAGPSKFPRRPPTSQKRKRNNASERTPSPELKLPPKRISADRLLSVGSRRSIPIDVDALEALKQRFPVAMEQQVCSESIF
jgi:hypothetical protein